MQVVGPTAALQNQKPWGFSSGQSLSRVRFSATPGTAARQASCPPPAPRGQPGWRPWGRCRRLWPPLQVTVVMLKVHRHGLPPPPACAPSLACPAPAPAAVLPLPLQPRCPSPCRLSWIQPCKGYSLRVLKANYVLAFFLEQLLYLIIWLKVWMSCPEKCTYACPCRTCQRVGVTVKFSWALSGSSYKVSSRLREGPGMPSQNRNRQFISV